jgi:Skp family chaperone for outer membrane proteins
MKTKLLAAAALAAAALPTVALAQQRPPAPLIVVVDTQRILRECTACQAASAQLQGLITSARARAQQLGQPLQAEAQSIEQAATALRNQSGTARTTGETALNARVQQFQQRQTAAQQEIQQLEQNIQSTQQNVVQQINVRLNPIINQVMTARGANLALDVGATLAHAQGLNVTNDVLASLNQQLPSVSVTPLPQPAQTTPAQPQPQTPRPQGR